MPPTPFQKKILWFAFTALAFAVIGGLITLVGWLVVKAISFLQPVLVPLAIAAILAYLLDPVVTWLESRRLSRTFAVIIVFLAFLVAGAGILLYVIPPAWRQGHQFATHLPEYTASAQNLLNKTITEARKLSEQLTLFKNSADPNAQPDVLTDYAAHMVNDAIAWIQQKGVPEIAAGAGRFLRSSFGFFGFLLSLILVPIFLFFFLNDARGISNNWSRYLPLRASPLKSEIVSLLSEINRYLINFFRGQLMVSLIDGVIIGICLLVFVRLDFALLIGLMVGVLGLIPYVGMMICWIPAVIIAAAQFGDWWPPLLVTIIFIAANNIDGMLIAPKIVGDSVGLHPLTVILSVIAWSIILGGILGALLAVPLTATLKVLLKRYFWDRPGDIVPEGTAP